MTEKRQSEETWNALPAGALPIYAKREQFKYLRRVALRLGGAVSLIILAAIVVNYVAFDHDTSGEPNYGGIRCTKVRSNAALYLAGKLDARLSKRIKIHLEQCDHCRQDIRRMSAEIKQTQRFSDASKR